jgi:TnpA family transposase
LRLGTADAESILRRFTKNNVQHPTYKALCELGKALKTVFLCDGLRLDPPRRFEGSNSLQSPVGRINVSTQSGTRWGRNG